MKFVLATGNVHKVTEIAALLPEHLTIVPQGELGVVDVPETGLTFVENALIKARHASRETGLPAIADDSGLCVDALGGRPGIRSARFAGAEASDADNTALLLEQLDGIKTRSASFYCLLVCLADADDPSPLIASGQWCGEITTSPEGSGGFGYDPVFFVPSLGCTAASLPAAEKNRLSHRGQALGILANMIRERYTA